MEKCKTLHCRNKKDRGTLCFKCISRRYRSKNKIKAAFYNLKSNAKRRNKFFDLTIEQFTQFAIETDYIKGKGKSIDSFSIDRIDNAKGYTIENIQILSISDNAKKGVKILNAHYDDYEKKVIAFVSTSQLFSETHEDCPFLKKKERNCCLIEISYVSLHKINKMIYYESLLTLLTFIVMTAYMFYIDEILIFLGLMINAPAIFEVCMTEDKSK